MSDINTTRRGFFKGAAAMVGAGAVVPVKAAGEAPVVVSPYEGTKGVPLKVGAPCLQAPGETTMGVSWSVSGLSKGVVEIADNPEMKNSRIVKSGGYGLVPVDVDVLQVRLEGLKPATRYWYRTITTPFTDYRNIYDAKLGDPITGDIHSFMTMGVEAAAHFCVMNDTHAQWRAFDLITAKMKEIKPTAIVWNGDATNTTQHKKTAINIFLDPPVKNADYSADIPVFFESGNHDFRGSWISRKEEVILPRHPAERTGAEWDLKWNFAVRLGDIAMIGMDTGEDKPDGHPKWFGLANFEGYRRAQTAWLEKALNRPDIASAKYKIVFCHIPLYSEPGSNTYKHDGVAIDPHDYAHWSRECHDLWAPILEKHGVKAVICAHQHKVQVFPPKGDRTWWQIIGGGCETSAKAKDGTPVNVEAVREYPAVIEGKVEGNKLVIRAHNLLTKKVSATVEISA